MQNSEIRELDIQKQEALGALQFGKAADNTFKRFVIMALWSIAYHLYRAQR